MTLPPDPKLFLAHLQGTQIRHTKVNLAKELKMQTHSPPTPAEAIKNDHAHQPPHIQTVFI